MDHYEFMELILNINSKIRFVGIYSKGDYYKKMRKGLKPFLSEEETEKSMRQAILRMKSRQLLVPKIGNIHYALAKYDKLSRITVQFGKDGLIMMSVDHDLEYDPITEKILEISKKHEHLFA